MLTILQGDCLAKLRELPDASVHCCVTSPPYWGLRDYGVEGQLGLDKTPEEYVAKMVDVFREVRRVLRDDGTLWLNLGDSYSAVGNGGGNKNDTNRGTLAMVSRVKKAPEGLKPKDLVGIPWTVAFALRADGWYLRSDIIWHKPNPMPESVTDRPTKSHEYIFLLAKSERYFYDAEAIKEPAQDWGSRDRTNSKSKLSTPGNPHNGLTDCNFLDGRNKRTVWTVATNPYPQAHFAVYPPDLIKPCILAGCPVGGTVLDPFGGSGTTGMVALELGRKAVLIELNQAYINLIKQRCNVTFGLPL